MHTLTELLEKLRNVDDPVERNALAISATETGDPVVLDVLIELIDRPDLVDQRATLLNCAGRFDCSNRFLWLANLVCRGNWEVAHEAYDILVEIDSASSQDVKLAYDLLAKTCDAGVNDGWRGILINDLLSMFD